MRMIEIYTGKEISELRRALGLNPTEFAAKIGVSESAVNRWEKGNRTPKLATLIRMNQLAEKIRKQTA